jgi:hypothetical protein
MATPPLRRSFAAERKGITRMFFAKQPDDFY